MRFIQNAQNGSFGCAEMIDAFWDALYNELWIEIALCDEGKKYFPTFSMLRAKGAYSIDGLTIFDSHKDFLTYFQKKKIKAKAIIVAKLQTSALNR